MVELRFEKTCSACPEQYDVFKGSQQVGYIRLRHGILSCRYPDVEGQEVFHYEFKDEWKGLFDDDKERKSFLELCNKALLEKLMERKRQKKARR